MTELEYLAEVRRRELARVDFALDAIAFTIGLLCLGVAKLLGLL